MDILFSQFDKFQGIWTYYFHSLDIELYEFDIYVKIIYKIREKDFDFTENEKINVRNLIKILAFVCDEYEIKILNKIEAFVKWLNFYIYFRNSLSNSCAT